MSCHDHPKAHNHTVQYSRPLKVRIPREEGYSTRGIVVTLHDDVIVIPPCVKDVVQPVLAHYFSIGIEHTQNIQFSDDPLWSYRQENYFPKEFLYGDVGNGAERPDSERAKVLFQRDSSWYEITEQANNKIKTFEMAEAVGVATPVTIAFPNGFSNRNPKDLITDYNLPIPCAIKPAVSVSGFGITLCCDEEAFSSAVKGYEAVPVQVQELLPPDTTYLNVVFDAGDHGGALERYQITSQNLVKCIHNGNLYDSNQDYSAAWQVTEPLARHMTAKGMKGMMGFDVAVVPDYQGSKEPTYLLIECNPRFNGSCYPGAVAHKFRLHEQENIIWTNETFKMNGCTPEQTLKELGELAFNEHTKRGVVVINSGIMVAPPGERGKIACMMIGHSKEEVDATRQDLQNRGIVAPLPS